MSFLRSREYVDQVANLLRDLGVSVFYDLFEEASSWGKNLYEYLSDIYQNKALYTIMFISQHYARKRWPNHEREAMQARAFQEHQEYILPARFDDTQIPGVLPTVAYIPLTDRSPQDFVKGIHKKLVTSGQHVDPIQARVTVVNSERQPIVGATVTAIAGDSTTKTGKLVKRWNGHHCYSNASALPALNCASRLPWRGFSVVGSTLDPRCDGPGLGLR